MNDSSTLASLDVIAQDMTVLVKEQDLAGDVELGGDLTARFVRTWRTKQGW